MSGVLGTGVLGVDTLGVVSAVGAADVASLLLIPDLSNGPGLTDVILSHPGGADARVFSSSDFAMSRAVNDHGSLAFDLALDDVVAWVSSPDRLRFKWVRWGEHATLGVHTGVIIDVRSDPDLGIVDCTAYGHSWRLKRRITPRRDRVITGPPGAVITSILTSVGADDPLPISGIDADEAGDPITFEARAQNVYDVIRAVQTRSNQEWLVDPETRRLQWRVQIGTDRTGTVQLMDGVHIAGYAPVASGEGMTNALFAQPDDARYRAQRGFWATRDASIDLYGRLEESQTYVGAVTRSSLGPIARADLARRSRRGRTLTLDVADVDGCFGLFGLGDTIRVSLDRIETAYDFRVMAQSWRADTNILSMTGYVP